jgi:hypothetical protein
MKTSAALYNESRRKKVGKERTKQKTIYSSTERVEDAARSAFPEIAYQ